MNGGVAEGRSYRLDVEGLRAVAIGGVLLYHAGLPFVSGGYVGVDVFFVISGFLMTGLLVNEVATSGTIAVGRFYLRRVRRLVPAAATTLVTTAALAWLFLSPVQRGEVARDVLASAGYVLNWRLVSQSVDYLGGGENASPVQHFWSLAVEEQFYLAWPLLLLALAWAARRLRRDVRTVVTAGIVALGVVSLGYGVLLTAREGDVAYFNTAARGWEFAIGGVVALVVPRLPRRVAAVLAWTGLAVIAVSALWFDDRTPSPGAYALVPTLGTAAVLAAGATAPLRVLTTAPVRYVGRISYSWYLWHWPAIVFAGAVWGPLAWWQGVLVTAASVVPSALTYRYVETRVRRSPVLVHSQRRTVGVGAAATGVAAAAGLLLPLTVPHVQEKRMDEVSGAQAIQDQEPVQEKANGLRPKPQKARKDWPLVYDDGCHVDWLGTSSDACVYGNVDSATTVVLFGDSHAMQYFPALEALANERRWKLVSLTKSGCSPADVRLFNATLKRKYDECDEWRADSLERIAEKEQPDLVVTTGRDTYQVLDDEDDRLDNLASAKALDRGMTRTLRQLRDTGAHVTAIGDNPHPDKDIPNCVAEKMDRLSECAIPEKDGFAYEPVSKPAAEQVDGVEAIDPTPVLCREAKCPAVIGDVIVYGQTTHLTATYARTMSRWLDEQLPSVPGTS